MMCEVRDDSGALTITFPGISSKVYRGGLIGAAQLPDTAPSLADKDRFFPAVLCNSDFQKNGILFGEDPSLAHHCMWLVIDPNRHKLRIWEKGMPTDDFVVAGQALNASVFTNGPMVFAHNQRNPYVALGGYLAQGTVQDVGWAWSRSFTGMAPIKGGPFASRNDYWNRAADDWFGGAPYGNIESTSNQIRIHVPPCGAPVGYFGRKSGTGFDSYEIGYGDPVGFSEATGGLLSPGIKDFKVLETSYGANQWFYWGLAPLRPKLNDAAGLGDAIAAYSGSGRKPLTGLIVGVFYQDNCHVQLLADIGVRDAVRLDGSDSVLFGHDTTLLWGEQMTSYKRIWMRWGCAFFPY
jgi:hypothetical protein